MGLKSAFLISTLVFALPLFLLNSLQAHSAELIFELQGKRVKSTQDIRLNYDGIGEIDGIPKYVSPYIQDNSLKEYSSLSQSKAYCWIISDHLTLIKKDHRFLIERVVYGPATDNMATLTLSGDLTFNLNCDSRHPDSDYLETLFSRPFKRTAAMLSSDQFKALVSPYFVIEAD